LVLISTPQTGPAGLTASSIWSGTVTIVYSDAVTTKTAFCVTGFSLPLLANEILPFDQYIGNVQAQRNLA
jgi:hypothetical protein